MWLFSLVLHAKLDTVKPQSNEPLYEEDPDITNDAWKLGPRDNEPPLKRTYFASPLALRYIEVTLHHFIRVISERMLWFVLE